MAKTVVLIDPRPIMALGVCEALKGTEVDLVGSFASWVEARPFLQQQSPDVILIHVSYADFSDGWCNMVVWGPNFTYNSAKRFLRSPILGVVLDSANTKLLLQCLGTVACGDWFLDPRIGPIPKSKVNGVAALTATQKRVYDCLLEDLSNRQIAARLSIKVGTVKVHCSKIFMILQVKNRKVLKAKFFKQT
jgi:DNA-binding NarL/FixJ family response regulator